MYIKGTESHRQVQMCRLWLRMLMNAKIRKTHYEHVREYVSSTWGNYLETLDEIIRPLYGPNPTFQQFVEAVMDPNDRSIRAQKNAMIHNVIFYHLYHMYTSGEKIYHISSGLSARLARTSLNLDSRFLKSPFREIYVQIDRGLFHINDRDMHPTPVDGFYVHYSEDGSHKKLRIMAVSLMRPEEGIPFNDENFFFRIELEPGSIEDQIRTQFRERVKNQQEDLEESGALRNIDYVEDFALYIINTLMYITSKGADLAPQVSPMEDIKKRLAGLKNPAKKRKLLQKVNKQSRYIVIVAGCDITDNQQDVEDIARAGSVGRWKLDHQVHVSGHWRAQWYGSEKDASRRQETIWVMDYTKGPEFAEIVNKPYLVR